MLMFWAALGGVAAAQGAPHLARPNGNPVGHWRMNEAAGIVAFDSSVNQNHGTVVGGAFLAPDALRAGVLACPGAAGGLVIPQHKALEPQEGTILVWVNLARAQDADVFFKMTDRFVRTGVEGKRQVYGLRLLRGGGVQACVADDDPESSSPWTCAYTWAPVKAGRWHLLAMRWDGRTLTVFRDGQARGTQAYRAVAGLGLSYAGDNPLLVGVGGVWGAPGPKDFSGQMSDLMVFDRALSDQEIRAVHRSREGLLP